MFGFLKNFLFKCIWLVWHKKPEDDPILSPDLISGSWTQPYVSGFTFFVPRRSQKITINFVHFCHGGETHLLRPWSRESLQPLDRFSKGKAEATGWGFAWGKSDNSPDRPREKVSRQPMRSFHCLSHIFDMGAWISFCWFLLTQPIGQFSS